MTQQLPIDFYLKSRFILYDLKSDQPDPLFFSAGSADLLPSDLLSTDLRRNQP